MNQRFAARASLALRTSTQKHKGLAKLLWVGLLTITVAEAAHSASCISASSSTGAFMRESPKTGARDLGRLRGTAPLIAIMPRWYETRTPSGAQAFVSKQATNIIVCAPIAPAAASSDYEIHAIDVGTGLAILVRGSDFTLLFDAGTNDDLARGADNRVLAYMRAVMPEVTRIDHLLLSHPHRDHVELMPDILDALEVSQVWDSGAYNNICGYRAFLRAVSRERGVQYHTATNDTGDEAIVLPKKKCYGRSEPRESLLMHYSGLISDDVISLGQGASMRILHADGSKRPSFNENSLVLRLDLGSHRVLLVGDAEAGGRKSPNEAPVPKSVEGKLLDCCSSELAADVLVVGHHGSKTSSRSRFLDAIGANVFVVSSGPTRYATVVLPDDEVISELERRGEVYRTDLDDEECGTSEDKIGPDEDGRPGGCSNVVVSLPAAGAIAVRYQEITE